MSLELKHNWACLSNYSIPRLVQRSGTYYTNVKIFKFRESMGDNIFREIQKRSFKIEKFIYFAKHIVSYQLLKFIICFLAFEWFA